MPHCLPRLQYNWVGFPLPFLGAFVPESVLNISFRKGHICESICVPNDSEEGPVEFHLFSKKIPSSTKRIRRFWKNCATYPFHFRVLESLVLNHTDEVRGQVKLSICWLYTARKAGGGEREEKKKKKEEKACSTELPSLILRWKDGGIEESKPRSYPLGDSFITLDKCHLPWDCRQQRGARNPPGSPHCSDPSLATPHTPPSAMGSWHPKSVYMHPTVFSKGPMSVRHLNPTEIIGLSGSTSPRLLEMWVV